MQKNMKKKNLVQVWSFEMDFRMITDAHKFHFFGNFIFKNQFFATY